MVLITSMGEMRSCILPPEIRNPSSFSELKKKKKINQKNAPVAYYIRNLLIA